MNLNDFKNNIKVLINTAEQLNNNIVFLPFPMMFINTEKSWMNVDTKEMILKKVNEHLYWYPVYINDAYKISDLDYLELYEYFK